MTSDVLVIGGGPAGMFAAITAAKNGANVVLLERNDRLGKKLLITGKGRCNVTNDCTAEELCDPSGAQRHMGIRKGFFQAIQDGGGPIRHRKHPVAPLRF